MSKALSEEETGRHFSTLTQSKTLSSSHLPDLMEMVTGNSRDHERLQLLKAFDETKAGLKGIVDSGITQVPQIFVRPKKDPSVGGDHEVSDHFSIPVVDLSENDGRRAEVIDQVRRAAESYGFFQVVNHGIPERVMEEMIDAACVFHELPKEEKAEYYSRGMRVKVNYYSGGVIYDMMFADWRDTLRCNMNEQQFDPQDIPLVCSIYVHHLQSSSTSNSEED